MRKQIVCGMLLLILLILPISVYMQINQSFSLSVDNARESSLREEAAISRVMMLELQQRKSSATGGRDKTDDIVMQVSQQIAQQFGSPQLDILVFLDGTPLTGPLTERTVFLLNAKSRSTYLSSADESLYVIHPLDNRTTLITKSDYSGFYTMRRQQTTYGVLLCVGGLVLATTISLLISGGSGSFPAPPTRSAAEKSSAWSLPENGMKSPGSPTGSSPCTKLWRSVRNPCGCSPASVSS